MSLYLFVSVVSGVVFFFVGKIFGELLGYKVARHKTEGIIETFFLKGYKKGISNGVDYAIEGCKYLNGKVLGKPIADRTHQLWKKHTDDMTDELFKNIEKERTANCEK